MKSLTFAILFLTNFIIHGQTSNRFKNYNNDYAFKMHKALIAENINVLTSPLTYITQLALLYLGAEGQTANEIYHSVNFSTPEIHEPLQEILTRLRHSDGSVLKMANVVGLRQDFQATEWYLEKAKKYYEASVKEANIYKNQESMKNINNWINRTTEGKIPQLLLSPLDAYNRLVFLTGVYFSTQWSFKFNSIQRGNFYNKNKFDDVSSRLMMSVNGRFPFARFNIYNVPVKALELPLGEDLRVMFLLPKSSNSTGIDGLIKIEQQLTEDGFRKILTALKEEDVQVTIPMFKLEPGHDLMWSIQFLGIHRAFNNAADLRHLSSNKGLYVTKVLHKMVLDINDNGDKQLPRLYYVSRLFRANRPFLFFVRDTVTGMVLFMGRVVGLASQ